MVEIGDLVLVKGSRPANRVWRVLSFNERDRAYHVKTNDGSKVYRDVFRSEIVPLSDQVEPSCDCASQLADTKREIEQLTQERDRYFDSAAHLRADLKAARSEAQRLNDLLISDRSQKDV